MNSGQEYWHAAVLPLHVTVGHAVRNLDQSTIKIVIVLNRDGQLEGTITDGDIRRGLLKGLDLSSPISKVLYREALVVPPELSREQVMHLMVANKIRQIPVVDAKHRVVGLHLWEEISAPSTRPNLVVIMAGGMGTRLLPHTENCPKPMLPVAGKPILEHIITRAKNEGFSRFVLSVHYLGQIIEDYFQQGEILGVKIDYLREKTPLGTAGALSMLHPLPDQAFVVTNGDVVTDIRYGELLDFHAKHHAVGTMAVRLHEWQHPFGVVQTRGVEIVGFEEKPVARTHINAGVYALSPRALRHLSKEKPCDMPTLFQRLQAEGSRTVAYPMHEPWLDVGEPKDLLQIRESSPSH